MSSGKDGRHGHTLLGLIKEIFNWYPSNYPAAERNFREVSSARWLLPALEVLWGLCTFAQSRVTNVHQLYACRFLIGMLEAPVFAGTHFILGIPDSPKPFYFTDEDIKLAKKRLDRAKIRKPGKLGLDVFKRSLKRWHIWVFVFCYICMIICGYPDSYMNLWLKEEEYSVVQINRLPTVTYAINIVASWLGTTLAAIYPSWTIYTGATASLVFSTICMIVWTIPTALKFVAYYVLGMSGCLSPILYSTVNTVVKGDSEERALIMGSMMTFGYSFNIWVPLLLFPTVGPNGAPRWRIGWPVSLVFRLLLWAGFILVLLLYRRDSKRSNDDSTQETESYSTEEPPVVVQSEAHIKE
ncbi:hypothetical protein SLS62_000383 [Diatrype stigma]|uniref:Uncharacterized protein n=1 Tax=Diatrype stigma TaxID=117547 RepID=A0AAN9YUE3_9PEZI